MTQHATINLYELSVADIWALYQLTDKLIEDAEETSKRYTGAAEKKAAREYIMKWNRFKNGIRHDINNIVFEE